MTLLYISLLFNRIMEIWKDIKGFEGRYQVSSLGRIKSLKRYQPYIGRWKKEGEVRLVPEKILKTYRSKLNRNYINLRISDIRLSKRERRKTFLVYRLVAEAFIKNPENKREVNHINGIPYDDRLENLEWVTKKENSKHAIENNLHCMGEKIGTSKLTEKEVKEIRAKYKPRTYSLRKLANEYNVSSTQISKIINRQWWKHV